MIYAQVLRAVYRKEFPEWVRLPALVDADLLCLPVNWRDEKRGINVPKGDGKIDPSPHLFNRLLFADGCLSRKATIDPGCVKTF